MWIEVHCIFMFVLPFFQRNNLFGSLGNSHFKMGSALKDKNLFLRELTPIREAKKENSRDASLESVIIYF